jgi:anti-sigma regulatory factor (Ser/Thr protein kinase)
LTLELIDFKILILKNRENYLEVPWKNGYVGGIFTDRDHTIWIYGEEGLFRLLSTSFINYTEDDGLETNIWSLVEDSNHNIWFGSLNKSLQRWNGRKLETIQSYKKINDGAFFMGSASLYDGRIFFTQGDRVLQYEDNVFSEVPYAKDQAEKIYQSPVDSSVFIAAVSKGLIIEKNGRIRSLERFSVGKDGWISDIAYDPKGFYWLVTSKTLAKLYPDSVYVYPVDQSPLKSGYVVEVDSTGTPWFGGKEGLFMFDHSSAKFSKLEIEGSMITVNGLSLMRDQRLLAGRMKDIVVIDALGFKNSDKNFYRIYDAGDGFLGYEVQQDGIMRDHEGNFWISCIDRVVKFIPANDYYLRPVPVLNISSIDFLNENLNWEKLSSNPLYIEDIPDTLRLHHKQNSLKLNFIGVTTYSSDKVKYSYRLNNGKEWSEPTTQNELLLPELNPGKYELQVKVSNAQNEWSDPVKIHLNLVPAFWQTSIFKASLILIIVFLIALSVSLVFRQKHRKKEKEFKLRNEIFSLRIRELVSQFDPHFTFNILSTLGGYIMLARKEKAYAYLLKFASVLRNVLSESDKILRPLKEEMEFVKEYCEMQKYQLEDKLEYYFTPLSSTAEKILVPRMVIHSFVENAIKHGIQPLKSEGKITIDYQLEDDFIRISIKDNGIGRKRASEEGTTSTGKGLSLSKEVFKTLSEYYKKPFQYRIIDNFRDNGSPAGTEIELTFPSKL